MKVEMNVTGAVCCAVLALYFGGCGKADGGRVLSTTAYPARGRLLDCKGQVLAMNGRSFKYYLDPKDIRMGKEEAARAIATALDLDANDVLRKCNDEKSRYVFLAKCEGEETVEKLRDRGLGIHIQETRVRKIEDPKLAVLLGEVRSAPGDERLMKGCSGLEYVHDECLRGVVATNQVVVGPDGAEQRALTRNKPKNGCDVMLTIDRVVQSALQDVLEKFADTNDTGRAWGVVMEVKTGAIRAIAETCSAMLPTNDNGQVAASCFHYEAGSVIKPFTVAIALDCGLAKIDTPYSTARDDEHYHKLPSDWGHAWPATLTIGEAMVKSSNIVLGKLSYDLGPERLYLGLRSFGFGENPDSGLGLESPGILRDCRKFPWGKVERSRIGIGQGLSVTVLQLARGYAILANGGVDVRPYTVEKIVDPAGTVKFQHCQTATNRVVGAAAAAMVCRALERVVGDQGTARCAAVEGVHVAGKTGTTHRRDGQSYSDEQFISSFAGFFPAECPEYVIIVAFETKKTSGSLMHMGGHRPALAFAELVKTMRRR